MTDVDPSDQRRRTVRETPPRAKHGHLLARITQWLPGQEPTSYDIALSAGEGYRTQFWRCTRCGQERNRRAEFSEPCSGDVPTPLSDGGYSVEDLRTRRALAEDMEVRFGTQGPTYEVHSESGNVYETDLAAEKCTCPDHQHRATYCKHLRRVDIEVRIGTVPAPDGQFNR